MAPGTFGGTFEDWLAALHPDDRAECVSRVERALADPGPYMLLHRSSGPTGRSTGTSAAAASSPTTPARPTGTIGVVLDVTDRQEAPGRAGRKVAEDHRLIQSMQRALLPVRLPEVPGVEFAARYEAAPGSAIGGDWYAFVPLQGRSPRCGDRRRRRPRARGGGRDGAHPVRSPLAGLPPRRSRPRC